MLLNDKRQGVPVQPAHVAQVTFKDEEKTLPALKHSAALLCEPIAPTQVDTQQETTRHTPFL